MDYFQTSAVFDIELCRVRRDSSCCHSLSHVLVFVNRFRASQSFEKLSRASRTSSWNRHRKRSTRLGNSRAQQPTQRVSRGKQTSLANFDPYRKLAWWLMPSEDRRGNTRCPHLLLARDSWMQFLSYLVPGVSYIGSARCKLCSTGQSIGRYRKYCVSYAVLECIRTTNCSTYWNQ